MGWKGVAWVVGEWWMNEWMDGFGAFVVLHCHHRREGLQHGQLDVESRGMF